MANIRVDLDFPIIDGSEAVFIAPCDCSDIAGLVVYYPSTIGANATTRSKEFIFKDAHGSDLSCMDHLFKTGVYVKVLLNVTEGIAYIQNADTNSYIEGKFSGIVIAVNTSKWVKQDDGTYTNTVAAEQIVEGDLLDASLYGEYTEEQAEAFDFLIESIEAQNGKVVFTASEKIEVSLSILLRGRVNMEEKNVFVHDLKAASIEYDNTKSGLKATNPQDAIDELATSISGLVVVVTADGWNTQDDGTFRKIIPVEQITGDETFDISLYPGDIPTEEQVVAFSEYVTSIETSEGAIILTASKEINVQFRIFLYGKVNFDNNVVLMKEYSAVDIAFDDTVAKLGAKNIQEADVALALRPVNNNILINSDFTNPVNQRGQSVYTRNPNIEDKVYTIDRWKLQGYMVEGQNYESSTLTVNDGYITIDLKGTYGTEHWVELMQSIEFAEKYHGKTLTFSAKYRLNSLDDLSCLLFRTKDGSKIENLIADGQWHVATLTVTPSINGNQLEFGFYGRNNYNMDIEWAKLEIGEVATPYVPRLYAEEFQLCQRYYQKIDSTAIRVIGNGDHFIRLASLNGVKMRINGTVILKDTTNLVIRDIIDSGWTITADGYGLIGGSVIHCERNSHGISESDFQFIRLNCLILIDAEL